MKIRIQTTQNVDLEYEVAGIGYRFIAALIDLGIFLGYLIAIGLLLDSFGLANDTISWVIAITPLLFYPVLCETLLDGQTFGKKAMSLKVVKVDGSQPTIGDYILRWLLWIVEASPFSSVAGLTSVGIVSIVVTEFGQRLGDLAAGTTVVRIATEADMHETIFSPVGENYSPQWPQVIKLNDRDITIIRKGFDAIAKGADEAVLTNIAYKVASVLEIDRTLMGPTESFLKTIVNDYNYLTGQTLNA